MLANELPLTVLDSMKTNTGETVYEQSQTKPIMLVFLRHFGCTFCREALSDLSKQREEIEQLGVKLVFVHMSDEETANEYFNEYHLAGSTHVCDPECRYYQAFGLAKGSFNQLFGLATWIRGFSAGVVAGHGIGPRLGDDTQMPGIFIVSKGEIKNSFVHKLASDRPDYVRFARESFLETD